MSIRDLRPSAAAVLASLFLAVLPLSYLSALELAARRGALEQAQADALLPGFRALGAPGLLLSAVTGYEPMFWVEHATGRVFWKALSVFLVANFVGWLGLCTGIPLAFRFCRTRLLRPRPSSDT